MLAREKKDGAGRTAGAAALAVERDSAFARAFRRCDAGEERGGYAYFIGMVGAEQIIVRARLRPLAASDHYVDAQVVAGGGRLSGAQLLEVAGLLARALGAKRPCRVRTFEERYRAGRVRTVAQGLVDAARDYAELDGELIEGGAERVVERFGCAERAVAALIAHASGLCLRRYYAARGRASADRGEFDETGARLLAASATCSKMSIDLSARKLLSAIFGTLRRGAPSREHAAEGPQLELLFGAAAASPGPGEAAGV